MRKLYTKVLLGLVLLLWVVYFITSMSVNKKEPFMSSVYRPYVRVINQKYESFVNNYGPDVVVNKLKKWNIY